MLTAMICEDELIDREALRRLICESFAGIRLLDDCVNGDQSLERALAERPDIMILDINMPGLNGIQVVKLLREEGYAGKIMIHTAYDYFTYAQDALNYGADAFLLKPVKHAQFIATIEGFIEKITNSSNTIDRLMTDELYGYLISEYIMGNVDESHKDALNYIENNIASAAIVMLSASSETRVLLRMNKGHIRQSFKLIAETIQRESPDGFRQLRLDDAEGCWAIYHHSSVPIDDGTLYLRAAHAAGRMLISVLKNHGIYLQTATRVFARGIKGSKGAIDAMRESLTSRTVEEMLLEQDLVRENLLSRDEAIDMAEKCEQRQFWIQWLDVLSKENEDISARFARGAAVILSLRSALPDGAESGNSISFQNWPRELEKEQIDDWVDDSAQQILYEYFRQSQRVPQIALSRACNYIMNHYQADLSLIEVAEYAGVSASYLSHQFKENLGIGFVDYLQNMRMQKLMELLRQRNYSIRELAQMLGYNSHTYFCRVVRQRTGKTINQLKKQISKEKGKA
ncbi:MAG: response regulator [Clostridia bacterium]|nr:response regulator [Clostridia bacterium]